jgi:hypothetical protein
MRAALAVLLAVSGIACGGAESFEPISPMPEVGRGPDYRLRPAGSLARTGKPIHGLRCARAVRKRFGVHLEIVARRLDVVIPAGIGVAPPRSSEGVYVRNGRCWYPVRTLEPTGVIEIDEGTSITLGEFFDVWGQPLSSSRIAGFGARRGRSIAAFVNGLRWRGEPRRIPLERHAAIVLEVGGYFPPTKRYVFPPGL